MSLPCSLHFSPCWPSSTPSWDGYSCTSAGFPTVCSKCLAGSLLPWLGSSEFLGTMLPPLAICWARAWCSTNSSLSHSSAPLKTRSTPAPSPSPPSPCAASRISAPSAFRLAASALLLPSSAASSPNSASAPCWPAPWRISCPLRSSESFHERKGKRESNESKIETQRGVPACRTRGQVHPGQNQAAPAHRFGSGLRPRPFRRRFHQRDKNPIREDSKFPAIHGHRARRTSRDRQRRRYPGGRHARPRPPI